MWDGRWEIDYGNVDEIFEQRGLLYTELVAKMPCLFNKNSDHDDFESVDNLGRPGHGLPGNSYRGGDHISMSVLSLHLIEWRRSMNHAWSLVSCWRDVCECCRK